MKKIVSFCVLFVVAAGVVFAQNTEPKVAYAVLNNDYYLGSLKERNLARLTLEAGDYDQSSKHSTEAERLARLSDEYIAKKILETKVYRALTEAGDQIAWAKAVQAATYFPEQLKNAEIHFSVAQDCRKDGDLYAALENALAVKKDLEAVAEPPPMTASGKVIEPEDVPLNPDQYRVRPWDKFGDCFWNIAERFYSNPKQWPLIYDANKDKIPDPNNPNLIEVGTVIDIPSASGEQREGRYDTGKPYPIQR